MDNIFLFQEEGKNYIFSYESHEVFYYYDRSSTDRNSVKTASMLGGIIGANIFPHILNLFNFDIFNSRHNLIVYSLLTAVLSWVSGYIFVRSMRNKLHISLKIEGHLFSLTHSEEILMKALKNRRVIKRIVILLPLFCFMIFLVFMKEKDFTWLFGFGVSIFFTSMLFSLWFTRTKIVDMDVEVDNQKSYKLLKKLKKEGIF